MGRALTQDVRPQLQRRQRREPGPQPPQPAQTEIGQAAEPAPESDAYQRADEDREEREHSAVRVNGTSPDEEELTVPVVLIADDDASVRVLVRTVMESEGFTVVEAADGREALELIRARKPDVALIDVGMPKLDGFSLLRELSTKGEGVQRVVLVTGAVEEEDYIRGWGLGADAYVSKPFDPEALVGTVQEVLGLSDEELGARREREIERARLLRQLDRFLDEDS